LKSEPPCLVCALNQTLKTIRLAEAEPPEQVELLRRAMDALKDVSLELSPAEISTIAIDSARRHLQDSDPFRRIKDEHTRIALALYPHFRELVQADANPILAATKLSASANLIDLGARQDVALTKEMEREAGRELRKNDIRQFEEELRTASSLLWIADNAGESVFDRLLLEQLEGLDVWIGVKGGPILNDVTMEDARTSGLGKLGRLISTGSDCLGISRDSCSEEFLELLDGVDIVVAKGHANFETLNRWGREIFFLLKAKCEVVARELGVDIGDTVFVRGTSPAVGY
jgi:uncharacterized protein with ATP-grasp and redox domains